MLGDPFFKCGIWRQVKKIDVHLWEEGAFSGRYFSFIKGCKVGNAIGRLI